MQRQQRSIGIGILLLICFYAFPAWAETAKVTLIEVQGNKRIETGTILAKIKTQEGKVFSPTLIKEDIRALYQLGHFEDVQVRTEGFEQGLKVIFSVKEKPLIREIVFQGNDELSDETLKEGLTLLPRTAVNLQLVNETADKLRLKYQDKGYYEAIVVPVITEPQPGERIVTFYIEEGEKVKLSDVIITGNEALSSREIKKALKNGEWWIFSFLGHSGTLRTDELKDDIETIKNLYYNKGYIQVQVEEPVIAFKNPLKRNKLVLRFNIKEGDQFRIGSITFKGNSIISTDELAKEVLLKPGDIFSRETLRQDVARIMDRYDSIARPFADVAPQFNIDSARKIVALTMEIQEGGEVRIGRIDITGNNKTRDKVIRREMRIDEGDLYSKNALKRSHERLTNLNFFETIDIVPERKQQEPVLDLNVKVKEKSTGSISVGGGYSTVDHVSGILDFTQGNLFGRGQVIKLKAQLATAGTTQQYVLSFMEPYLFDKPIWGRVDLYNQNVLYDGYDIKSTGGGLSIGKSLGEYLSASFRYGLDISKFKLSTENSDVPPNELLNQINDYGTRIMKSALSGNIAWDSRDFYLDPKSGSRYNFFVEYAGGPLGGDPTFYKTTLDAAWFYPLFWDTVFMLRGRFGYMESLISKPVPLGERFFVGGPGTVRGFKYGGAGPIEASTGDRLGGTKQLLFNAEYNFPIVPSLRLKGVLFYDIGRAFWTTEQREAVKFSELAHSAGWGLWWLSPMGPIKIEFGYALKKRDTDQLSVFDFSIGAMF
ncbi:MAG: outer membrane protein assembly factor BamA [Nitrospirota bacterium]